MKTPVDLDLIGSLAKRFANHDMYSEACELFEIGLRLEPENRGMQLSLAQIRNRLKQEHSSSGRGSGDDENSAEQKLREQIRRNAIDSSHFSGLAALYFERGKPSLAVECLEIALQKEPINAAAYRLRGKLLLQEKKYNQARTALRTGQRFNPFDRELAELLGRVEYECENYRRALQVTIDAFLLLPNENSDDAIQLKATIRTLKEILDLDNQDVVDMFRERRIQLQTAFDRLEMQRERYLQEKNAAREPEEDPEAGRIMMAARLRKLDLWNRLNDEQVFRLTRVAEEVPYADGEKIFSYRDAGADLYLLEAGEIVIRRPTGYGNYDLARLPPGTLFGELNFISEVERSGDALVQGEARLIRIDAVKLRDLIEERPDIGVKIYSCFWQGLAEKLRSANEQLRTFFSAEPGPEGAEKRQQIEAALVEVESAEKVELLREQGLSGAELQTLADFSNVKRFQAGTFLFHEGDPGNEMYVLLEGRVMISKYIPGGGEEALAILQRGDFFGEMSLIDGAPRSADAKAFQGSVTVIAFDDLTLQEVQAVDPRASLGFIQLLCRLMCKRLLEISEKVTTWRIMAGDRPDDLGQVSTELPEILAEQA